METLLVAQHRNQYSSRRRNHGLAQFRSFGSPSSSNFRDINCRTFQSGTGLLPTPLKAHTPPVTKRAFSHSHSAKAQFPSVNSHNDDNKPSKRTVKSSSIPIPFNIKIDSEKEGSASDEYSYSELWAGPAYSNSPPPSFLPIPKFSLLPKWTVTLDLPASGINFHHIAKSARPSPMRERYPSPRNLFHNTDSATKTLRRILNLDMAEE